MDRKRLEVWTFGIMAFAFPGGCYAWCRLAYLEMTEGIYLPMRSDG